MIFGEFPSRDILLCLKNQNVKNDETKLIIFIISLFSFAKEIRVFFFRHVFKPDEG